MKKRDPLRFRKSEVRTRDDGRFRHEFQQLPRATSARQLAFCILDEFKQTKVFVSQLLEDHLEGHGRSFLAKPPLAAKVAAVTDRESGPTRSVRRAEASASFSKLDRRLVTELVNGVVRRQGTLDAILEKFVARPRIDIEGRLWTLLQLGAYQLVLMTSVPVHSAVDETVELAKWLYQHRWCGFINGVLRSIAREVNRELLDEPASDRVPVEVIAERKTSVAEVCDPGTSDEPASDAPLATSSTPVALPGPRFRKLSRDIFPSPETSLARYVAAAWGLPQWLVERWSLRLTRDQLLNMAAWFEHRQPLSLRVNPLQTTRDELLARFAATPGLLPEHFGPGGRPEAIRYDGPIRVIDLPGFGEGLFTVQDETAMSASVLLDPKPGEAVLDLCAAPGTKTTHLAELMKNEGRLLAADSDGRRLRRVEENLQRLGLSIIEPLCILEDLSSLPFEKFDAILVDVPCSNTGVLGKRPEVRLRLQPSDIDELTGMQARLLNAAAGLLKPTGRIVYSTCSIEPEENTGVLAAFLTSHPEFQLVEQHEFIPGQPSDGGFQALLRKKN